MTALGEFGLPPDAVAWSALALAVLVPFAGAHPAVKRALRERPRIVVLGLAAFAFALSAGYVAFYLRGGPRIVDATSYYLEARALADGHVAFPVPAPSGSFRGRFLLPTLADDGARALSVIFPPGYPVLLALGFVLHAPLLVGPVLAFALVVVTAALAFRISGDERVACLAAAFSALCAVLRYHTADTMSHGLSALLLTTAVWAALAGTPRSSLLAGAAAGALVVTRPASGAVAVALVVIHLLFSSVRRGGGADGRRRFASVLPALAGAAVPVALFLWQQRVATGAWFGSTQLAYYAVADGPPGCFRYGFGTGIGCVFEHGDFVRARLRDGYGPLAALLTTLRRLKMHLADAGNIELFAPFVLLGVARALRSPGSRLLGLAFAGIVLAYVPFYFDGNYPGGGARFFADVLPIEHVLLAAVVVRMNLAPFALPLSLAGFALHTNYDHRALANRDGGRPMYEESVVRDAGVTSGLVFVDTDHGFALGHDPSVRDASRGVVVARRRHDAHDVVLWESLGRPPAFDYVFSPTNAAGGGAVANAPHLVSVSEFAVSAPLRFEAEAEWPPLAVHSGSAYPDFPACASGRRALGLHPAPGPTSVGIELFAPQAGLYTVRSGWVDGGSGVTATVTVEGRSWAIQAHEPTAPCLSRDGPEVRLERGAHSLKITAVSECSLDFVELVPAEP